MSRTTVALIVSGVAVGIIGANWKVCETYKFGIIERTPSAQVAYYSCECRRWWHSDKEEVLRTYVALPLGEEPKDKVDDSNIVYQIDTTNRSSSEYFGGRYRSDDLDGWKFGGATEEVLNASPEVRERAILFNCYRDQCAEAKQVKVQKHEWRGVPIYYMKRTQ
jgi:hypothetical protein